MKIKILEPSGWYKNFVTGEFDVDEYDTNSPNLRYLIATLGWVYASDCVITELPRHFRIKRYSTTDNWDTYICCLNNKYSEKNNLMHCDDICYSNETGTDLRCTEVFTEITVDDIIKHINYMIHRNDSLTVIFENGKFIEVEKYITGQEFDMSTSEGRLAYAKKYYPVGTKYMPPGLSGSVFQNFSISEYEPKYWKSSNHIDCGIGFIYINGKWAEIIKDETNMGTQKESNMQNVDQIRMEIERLQSQLEYAKAAEKRVIRHEAIKGLSEFTDSEKIEEFDLIYTRVLSFISDIESDDRSKDFINYAGEEFLQIVARNKIKFWDYINSFDKEDQWK